MNNERQDNKSKLASQQVYHSLNVCTTTQRMSMVSQITPGIEVALFNNREDAEKYQEDFESNKYRCPYHTYTVYKGEIIEEEIL